MLEQKKNVLVNLSLPFIDAGKALVSKIKSFKIGESVSTKAIVFDKIKKVPSRYVFGTNYQVHLAVWQLK